MSRLDDTTRTITVHTRRSEGRPTPEQPRSSIPRDIPDARVLQTAITRAGARILTVKSTLERTTYHCCGQTITDLHGTDTPRLLRHLPIRGRPRSLRIRPTRFRCPSCDDHPTATRQRDWDDPNAVHTNAYEPT